MIRVKIIDVINNYNITDLEIRAEAMEEMICTGRLHGELIHENEYGARYAVAKCLVYGNPIELLDMCREAQRNEFGFIVYPIDMFEIV